MPEPPSQKHILQALKAEPELLRKGYLDYNELECIVREAFASNPTKCCGYICGQRMQNKDVNDELVESMCVRLLCIQQVNMHRVPQIMAMFHDLADNDLGSGGGGGGGGGSGSGGSGGSGVNSRNIEMQEMSGETKRSRGGRGGGFGGGGGGSIGKDGLEEKKNGGLPSIPSIAERSDVQTEMEWNVDIMSGKWWFA